MELRVICAWCKRVMQDAADPNARVSHGICPKCYEGQHALLDAMDPKLKHPEHAVVGGEG